MKIVCDTTFLHGRDRFEKGDQRTVDDEAGAYFIAQGWAHVDGATTAAVPQTGDVTLNVHNAVHDQKVTHG
jgi:hypothetical protein